MDHQHVVLSGIKKNKTKGKENERQVLVEIQWKNRILFMNVQYVQNNMMRKTRIECELYEHWYHLQCTMIHQYNNLENIEFICIACQRVQLQQQKCMMLLYDIMCTKYRNVH